MSQARKVLRDLCWVALADRTISSLLEAPLQHGELWSVLQACAALAWEEVPFA